MFRRCPQPVSSALCRRYLMPLEILHFTFVLFGLLERCKSAQIATLARLGALLSRVQPKLSGFEFANHADRDAIKL